MSKAVQFDSYGSIDVLQVRDIPRPVPGSGEVLVQVRAAGINPSEAVIRSGALHHMFPATFPSGQGSDFAGVVAELGSGASGFTIGDGVTRSGAWTAIHCPTAPPRDNPQNANFGISRASARARISLATPAALVADEGPAHERMPIGPSAIFMEGIPRRSLGTLCIQSEPLNIATFSCNVMRPIRS